MIKVTEGDLRRSINLLQTCSSFVKVEQQVDEMQDEGQESKKMTVKTIESISGTVPTDVIENIVDRLFDRDPSFSAA